ncbi:hypothetical protein SPHINGO391_350367 [Sphingomonas aurantiaca]|uniref:Uncharacterized protein n=1 Tax=Sphingomonas aurantiaca TaxID=185949 RepID=A0A5E7Y6F7_9SPHN|nr:hypothetical protein SPHINGO391_350367 [Sphingomonas aurantiaca]
MIGMADASRAIHDRLRLPFQNVCNVRGRRFLGEVDDLDRRVAPERHEGLDRLVDIRLDRHGGGLVDHARTGPAAAFDQLVKRQLVQRAPRRDSRDAVLRAEFMLGGHRRPERQPTTQDIIAQGQKYLVIEWDGIRALNRYNCHARTVLASCHGATLAQPRKSAQH